jgi:hypothetical protein
VPGAVLAVVVVVMVVAAVARTEQYLHIAIL